MLRRYSVGTRGEMTIRVGAASIAMLCRPRFNAAPTQCLPVLTNDSGAIGIETIQWGTRPSSRGRSLYAGEGIKVDRLQTEPTVPLGGKPRRCLVISDGFYLWRMRPVDSDPVYLTPIDSGYWYYAGLITEFEPRNQGVMFSIVNIAANAQVSKVSRNMPAILSSELAKRWLDSEIDLNQLAHLPEVTGARFRSQNVDYYVKTTAIDGPECIAPPPKIRFVPNAARNLSKPSNFIKLPHTPRGIARPGWVEIQRRASESYKPLEGGRSDGNRSF